MQFFRFLGTNPLLNICFLSWFAAQVIKTILDMLSNRSLNLERLTGSGGMPSSHSALVSSLALGMARAEGYQSPMFALTLAFAAVVMYDAMGVRRAAGEQAKVLNKMIFDFHHFFRVFKEQPFLEFGDDDEKDEDEAKNGERRALKEYLGHTPLEVMAGALLGILLAVIYPI